MAYIVATPSGKDRSREYDRKASAKSLATRWNNVYNCNYSDMNRYSSSYTELYRVFEKCAAGWVELGCPINVIPE